MDHKVRFKMQLYLIDCNTSNKTRDGKKRDKQENERNQTRSKEAHVRETERIQKKKRFNLCKLLMKEEMHDSSKHISSNITNNITKNKTT